MPMDVDSLQIEIESTSSDAVSKLDQLTKSLQNLKSTARGGGGLTSVTNQLKNLATAASSAAGASDRIASLVSALKGLSSIPKAGGINSSVNAIRKLAQVDLSGIHMEKIQSISTALAPLGSVQKASGLNSTINALKKLPEISEALEKSDLDKFARQINQINQTLSPLANNMQKVSSAFSAFPSKVNAVVRSNNTLAKSNEKTAKTFSMIGTGINLYVFQRIASIASDWVKESNDYVENLNLFTVAMGEYAESAKQYAETVQEAMGIDSSDWMRNQGVFMQMASGFGVVAEDAALMSKNLTQLGYDISSFYNISIEEAMQKLQSGLAGEIEPLRRLGYAIDEASLKQVALNLGITQSIQTMTQAEKSQLRYVAIMQQSSNAMGDMARTIQTPANAMRILNQQITQLSRALGNLLIPFLQQVIPWVQAFVEVVTAAVQALALLFGFKLPTIDYSSSVDVGIGEVTAGANEAEDSLGGAAGAAKDLQRELLGIDELNIIEPNNAGGAGGGGGGGVSGGLGDLGLDLPEYDFLGGLDERTDQIKEFLRSIADEVLAIGAGLAAWKIAPAVLRWFDNLKNGKFDRIQKIALGIGLMVTGFTLEWQGAYDIGYNGPTLQNVLKTLIGSALGIAGSLLVFGTGPLGWIIGIGAALTIAIAGITLGYNQRQLDDELDRRFGEIELTVEEAKELAERIMSSPLQIQLDAYVEAKTTAQQAIETFLQSANDLNDLIWRVSVGLEVSFDEIGSSVDTMIANAQSYLDAQQEVYMLTINVGFTSSEVQSDMATFVAEYFNQSKQSLTELGTELKQTILDAMADGIIDEQEMKTIQNLQSEVNQMMAAVADAEYKAQLTNAVFDLESGDLSFESVKQVASELETIAQSQLDTLEQTHLDALALIELKYQTDGNYEEYVAALDDELNTYFSNQGDVAGRSMQTLMEKINASFSDVLEQSADEFTRPVSGLIDDVFRQFETDETGVLVKGSITDFMRTVEQNWRSGIQGLNIDDKTEDAIEVVMEALKPTVQQKEELAREYRAAGVAVPESLADGISDYYQLSAIEGNLDAINYTLGEKLSTDPNFIDALQTAKDAGIEINEMVAEGLANNIEVRNNADGTVSVINDAIGERVLQITPELTAVFQKLGIDITASLQSSATSGANTAMNQVGNTITSSANTLKNTGYNSGYSIGAQIGAGVQAGIKSKNNAVRNQGTILVNNTVSSMKAHAMIYSPSRLFRDEVGVYIGLGVAEGIKKSSDQVDAAANSLIDSTESGMRQATESMRSAMSDVGSGGYTTASEYYTVFAMPDMSKFSGRDDSYKTRESYDPNQSNAEIVSAILAAAQQVTTAVQESGGDVYMDGDKVGERVTAWQNQQNRIYGRPVQRI